MIWIALVCLLVTFFIFAKLCFINKKLKYQKNEIDYLKFISYAKFGIVVIILGILTLILGKILV